MLTLSGFEIDQVWKVNKIGWMQESLAQTGKYWKGTQRKGNKCLLDRNHDYFF